MAQSRALASQGENIEDSEQVVTSALAYQVWCTLPEVSDGSGTTVATGHVVSVYANSTGTVEVLDNMGKRVAMVRPFTSKTFLSRSNAVSPWQIITKQQSEIGKISDLSVTDGASTASALETLAGTYAKEDIDTKVDAAVNTVTAEIATNLATSFAEVQAVVNKIIAAMEASGVIGLADQTEGTATLALAAVTTPQVVDDSERTVTSGRAYKTVAVLPKITATGATTTVGPAHTVRFTATSTGPIEIWDFYWRRVGTCPAYGSITVRANEAANNTWSNLGLISETDAKVPYPKIAPLSVTMPTAAAPAMDGEADGSYTDAGVNAAMDSAIDTAFGGFNTTCATAFAAVETTVNAILAALEGVDVVATS